jgi:hypothetical protein
MFPVIAATGRLKSTPLSHGQSYRRSDSMTLSGIELKVRPNRLLASFKNVVANRSMSSLRSRNGGN